MKRTLLIFTAAAGMLLLGGMSAKADDGTTGPWTITISPSTGTFYKDAESAEPSSATWVDRWVSSDSPTITIANTNGSTTNNMSHSDDGIILAEGSSNSSSTFDFSVSVEDGYIITGMSATMTTEATDMTVTINNTVATFTEGNLTSQLSLSNFSMYSVVIDVSSSTESANESVTFTNWTVTVEEDPYATIDLNNLKIGAIGEAATSLPTDANQWYLLKHKRNTLTPAHDNGAGNAITRALTDDVKADMIAEDVADYLIRFIPVKGKTSTLEKSIVVNMQWATGNFWEEISSYGNGHNITTVASAAKAGFYNMYQPEAEAIYFAFNGFDLLAAVNNNGNGSGVSNTVPTWGSGELKSWEDATNTQASGVSNDAWEIYPVTLEEMSEEEEVEHEHEVAIRELIEEAQTEYNSYNGGYKKDIETGFSEGNGVGNGLIQTADQFSSPCSDSVEGLSFADLIDNNVSTFWHSDWHDSYTGGTHYLQVEMLDDFMGGPLLVNILRRNSNNDHITEMTIKSVSEDESGTESETEIGDIDLPFGGQGERVLAGFTCPTDVKTLRFYMKTTTTENDNFFHLAEFQLFYTLYYEDLNTTNSTAVATIQSAIETAQEVLDNKYVTETDIETLQTALTSYREAIGVKTIKWTLTPSNWGTLILPFDYIVADEGLTAYTCNDIDENSELTLSPEGAIGTKVLANTPYIVGGNVEENTTYTFTGVEEEEAEEPLTQGLLTGTLTGTTAPTNSYVLQDQGDGPAFYKVAADNTIQVGAYHCYLNAQSGEDGNAKAVVYFPGTARDDDDNVATAIEAVDGITTDSEAIYDLSGRKVTNPRSGIYIKGGKKVIIK